MKFLFSMFCKVFLMSAVLCLLPKVLIGAGFTLTPKIDLQVAYNDNLFLTNENEISDFMTVISPGLSFSLNQKHLKTDLTYELEFRKFLHETYLDRDEVKDIHRGFLNGIILPQNRFSIMYEGSIERITTDDRNPDVLENDIINITTRYRGLLRPRYQYRLTPKLTGEIAYQYETSQYKDDEERDFLDNEGDDTVDQDVSLLMEFNYSEKLTFMADANHKWHDSDGFFDYEMWYGLAGFVWRPKEHLSLEVKTGGAITEVDNNNDELKDTLYKIRLSYSPPRKAGYFVSYNKDFTTTADDGRYTWREWAGGLNYSGRIAAKLRVFFRENTYQFLVRKDEFYGGEFDLNYALTSKLSAGLLAGYENREYTPVKETAHRYRLNCSLIYKLKKAEIKLLYVANVNDSSLSFNDYTNNIISLNFDKKF